MINKRGRVLIAILLLLFIVMVLSCKDNDYFSVFLSFIFGVLMVFLTVAGLEIENKQPANEHAKNHSSVYKKIIGSFALANIIYISFLVSGDLISSNYPVFWEEAKLMMVLIVLTCAVFPLVNKYMR